MSKVLDQVSQEVIDYCPVCEEEIFFGQVAWKVGRELCCSVEHMLKQAKVVIVIAGREEFRHDYS